MITDYVDPMINDHDLIHTCSIERDYMNVLICFVDIVYVAKSNPFLFMHIPLAPQKKVWIRPPSRFSGESDLRGKGLAADQPISQRCVAHHWKFQHISDPELSALAMKPMAPFLLVIHRLICYRCSNKISKSTWATANFVGVYNWQIMDLPQYYNTSLCWQINLSASSALAIPICPEMTPAASPAVRRYKIGLRHWDSS